MNAPKNHQRTPEPLPSWVKVLIVAIIPIMTFMGGMVINAWTIADKIATKPFVEERVDYVKKYTDEKAAHILEQAFEHSDTNRRDLMQQMTVMTSDMRVSNATLATKVDFVITALAEMAKDRRAKTH